MVVRRRLLHGYKPKGEDTWDNGFNCDAVRLFKIKKKHLIDAFKNVES
jgi:hypothetical protein